MHKNALDSVQSIFFVTFVCMGVVRYFGAYLFLFVGYYSFVSNGIATYSLLIFSFGIIPLAELLLPVSKALNEPKTLWVYDWVLYSIVPAYIALLAYFITTIGSEQSSISLVGKITAMGILHGIFGINMAHELGHRKSKWDQFLAQLLLCTSQYTHFFIEHNRGHHKRVATPDDPATARKGENLYAFWIRTLRDSYRSAWQMEKEALARRGENMVTWKNDMVKYTVFQLAIIVLVFSVFGLKTLVCYLAASMIGILLLETINYIEHYGLLRAKISESTYERVQDVHSWNSDHLLGRYLLFELTRHSHHHENSLKKYPELQSKKDSSQLPVGYPGMMLLSMVPPLFFRVMDRRLGRSE